MQEEACCLSTSVEGIEAEVEDIIFGVQKVSKLSKPYMSNTYSVYSK